MRELVIPRKLALILGTVILILGIVTGVLAPTFSFTQRYGLAFALLTAAYLITVYALRQIHGAERIRYIASTGGVLLVTAFFLTLRQEVQAIFLFYLFAIITDSLFWGQSTALYTAVLSAIGYTTFTVLDPQFTTRDLLNIPLVSLTFLTTSILAGGLVKQEKARARELAVLGTIVMKASESRDLGRILDTALQEVLHIFGFESGAISLLDHDGRKLLLKVHRGLSPALQESFKEPRSEKRLRWRAINTGVNIFVEDLTKGFESLWQEVALEKYTAAAFLPLKAKERVVGLLSLGTQKRRRFSPEEKVLLATVVQHLGLVAENALLYEETAHNLQQIQSLRTFGEIAVRDMTEGILIEDKQGRITYVNPRVEEMLGYGPGELLGFHWSKIVDPEYTSIVEEEFAKRPHGISSRYEAALLGKDGRRVPVIISARPLFEGEDYSGVLVVFTDITEPKRAEEALRESENKFRTLAERSLVGVYLIQNGVFKYVNPQLAQIFRYDVEELIDKKGPQDVTLPEDWPIVEENLRKRLTGEVEHAHYAFRGITKDGQVIDLEVFGSRTTYHGQPAVVGTLLDITDRKRTEEALQQTNETLQALIQASPLAIMTIDPDGKVMMWNEAAERMFGWSRDEVLGRFLPTVPEDRLEEFQANRERVVRGEPVYGVETVRRRKDGALIDVSIYTAPLRDAQGNITGIMAAIADVTERKKIEEKTQRHLKEMETLNRVALAAASALTLDEALDHTTEALVENLGYPNVAILLLDPGSEQLKLHNSYKGISQNAVVYPLIIPRGVGVTGWVAKTKEPLLVPDVSQDPRYLRGIPDTQSEMCAPLRIGEKVIGVINVESPLLNAFHERDLNLLTTVASQVATLIENARLHEETRQHLEEINTLNRVALAAASALTLDEALERTTQALTETLGYQSLGFLLLDAEGKQLDSHPSYRGLETSGLTIPVKKGITGWVARTGEPLLVPDVSQDLRYIRGIPDTQSEMCVPLRIGNRIIGVLNVESPVRNAFNEHDLSFLSTIASHVATLIENARLHEEQMNRAKELELAARRLGLVQRISRAVNSTLELKQILKVAVRGMVETFGVERSGIVLFDEERKTGRVVAEHRVPGAPAGEGLEIPLIGNRSVEQVSATREPLAIEDAVKDPLMAKVRDIMKSLNTKSILLVPLLVKGEVIGTIGLDSVSKKRPFTPEEVELAQTIASEVAFAIENARLYEETKQLAITDSLTSLYNLRYFYQELGKEIGRSDRYSRPLSLIMFDIDGFKQYNDTYGHLAGDDLLKELAVLARGIIRRTDTLARYGGEEFFVILPETAPEEAAQLAQRLVEAVREYHFLVRDGTRRGQITVSCGVATYPLHADNAKALVQAADMALYKAKETKDRIWIYGSEAPVFQP